MKIKISMNLEGFVKLIQLINEDLGLPEFECDLNNINIDTFKESDCIPELFLNFEIIYNFEGENPYVLLESDMYMDLEHEDIKVLNDCISRLSSLNVEEYSEYGYIMCISSNRDNNLILFETSGDNISHIPKIIQLWDFDEDTRDIFNETYSDIEELFDLDEDVIDDYIDDEDDMEVYDPSGIFDEDDDEY